MNFRIAKPVFTSILSNAWCCTWSWKSCFCWHKIDIFTAHVWFYVCINPFRTAHCVLIRAVAACIQFCSNSRIHWRRGFRLSSSTSLHLIWRHDSIYSSVYIFLWTIYARLPNVGTNRLALLLLISRVVLSTHQQTIASTERIETRIS